MARKIKTPAKNKPAATPVEKKAKAPKVMRPTHGVTAAYAGMSSPFNSAKSRTALVVAEFGTRPDYVLTERACSALKPLKKKFSETPFSRQDLDAGVANAAIRKGVLNVVEGQNAAHEDCQLTFTDMAF